MKLTAKISIIYSSLFLIILLLISTIVVFSVNKHFTISTTESSQSNVESNVLQIEEFITGFEQILESFSSLAILRNGTNLDVYQFLNEIKGSLPSSITSAFWADSNGNGFTSESTATVSVVDREYYRRISNGEEFVITDPVLSKDTEMPISPLTYRVMSSDGSFKGIIGFQIGLNHLRDVVRNIKVGERGFSYIMTSTGQLIAHPELENPMEYNLLQIDDDKLNEIKEFGQIAVSQEKGVGRYSQEGVNYLAFFQVIRNTPVWIFVSAIPESKLRKESNIVIV